MTFRRLTALCVLCTLGVSALGLWYAKRIGVNEGDFIVAMRNPLLEHMRKREKNSGLTESADAAGFSAVLYDVKFTGQSLNLTPWLSQLVGESASALVKFPAERPSSLRLKLENVSLRNLRMTVRDSNKAPLLICREERCQEAAFKLSASTSVIEVHIDSPHPLSKSAQISLVQQGAPLVASQSPAFKSIDLHLSTVEELNLRTLTKSAAFIAQRGGYEFPANKVLAEMSVDGARPSQVRIGVSGRTAGHFSYPPSMGVTVDQGSTILGGSKFKLIRLEQRAGIVDFVTRSLLSNHEVLLPDQHLVRFSINGSYVGLYIYEENYSEEFFENMGVRESSVAGYDLDAFFREYPQAVRLKSKYTHNASGVLDADKESRLGLETAAFAKAISTAPMARLLAFVSLTRGTHGLGADDLRFYQHEATGRYEPIVRDLNTTIEPLSGLGWNREAAVSMGFWYANRLASVNPLLQLSGATQAKPLELSAGLQFWDVHPQVTFFLQAPENRRAFERHVLDYAFNGNLKARIAARARFLESELGSWTSEAERALIHSQTEQLSNPPSFLLDDWVKQSIQANGPLVTFRNKGQAVLMNRLPFGIALAHADPTTRFECGATLGPTFGSLSPEPLQIVPELSGGTCPVTWNSKISSAEWLRGLRATLANGSLVIATVAKKQTPVVAVASKGPPRIFVHLTHFEQTDRDVRLTYAVHSNRQDALNADASQLVFKNMDSATALNVKVTRKGVTTAGLPARSETLDGFPMGWEKAVSTPSQLFAANSELWTVTFPRPERPLYLRLEHASVQKAFAGAEAFVLDAQENFIASASESSLKSFKGIETVTPPTSVGGQSYVLKADTEYRINDLISISRGQRLTIEPGAKLVFGGRGGFLVEGVLQIKGTEANPVRLAPRDLTWQGIAFRETAADNLIEHAIFLRASRVRTPSFENGGGISLSDSRVHIEHSTFLDFLGPSAVSAYRSELSFNDNEITGSKARALEADFSWGKITSSQFKRNGGGGLRLSHSFFELNKNEFKENLGKDLDLKKKNTIHSGSGDVASLGFERVRQASVVTE